MTQPDEKEFIHNWVMEHMPLMEDKAEWYGNKEILYRIINQLKGREFAIMYPSFKELQGYRLSPPIRWGKAHTAQYFKQHLDWVSFFIKPYNLYRSTAHYTESPVFSFNMAERNNQMRDWNQMLDEAPDDYINGNDLFFDIDAERMEQALDELRRLLEFTDLFDLPVSISFSGSRGFHVILPYNNMPPEIRKLPVREQVALQKHAVLWIRHKLGLSCIDTAVSDMKRLKKIEWTIDCKSGLCCMPLTREQIARFDVNNMEWLRPRELLKNLRFIDKRETAVEEKHRIGTSAFYDMITENGG